MGVDDESVVRASEIVEANPVGLLHVWDGELRRKIMQQGRELLERGGVRLN